MRTKLLPILLGLMLTSYTINSNAQANKTLSNLTSPTTINQSLLPDNDNKKNLGSKANSWRNIYFGSGLYLKGAITMHVTGTNNFFAGRNAGNILISGINNTGVGQNALNHLGSGSYNTATGYLSLYSTTSGTKNTAGGYASLHFNTDGNYNTANGYKALEFNTTGSYNTACGAHSLYSNEIGSYNTANGYNALNNNKSGSWNTANGYQSLRSNITGDYNTASGTQAMYFNTTGYSNTASGYQAMYFNTEGYYNTANGHNSLYSNTTGFNNTANGAGSLYSNTTGDFNTASGLAALFWNTSGEENTAIGYQSLASNTIGNSNTAIGSLAMVSNTEGYFNTASGSYSLYSNTTGGVNTASGDFSLYSNTTGGVNTAIGHAALYSNTTGDQNTAIGFNTLYSNTTGSYNTALGISADVSTDNLSYATAIGANAIVDASYKVRIGNTSINKIGGQVGWSTFSDGRYKKDIKENIAGLTFINSLRPITYTVNIQGLNEYYNKGRKHIIDNLNEEAKAEMKKGEEAASKIVYNGFIAQEVEAAAKKLNYEFSGVDKPASKDGLYSLRYADFVVPLVKAVQELSKMNDEKDKEIEAQQMQIDELRTMLLALQQSFNSCNPCAGNAFLSSSQGFSLNSEIMLEQNIPNPFSHTTTIGYSLPNKFSSAQIIVTDKNGKQLKQIKISSTGKGIVNVDASTIASGAYNYSLYVDGKLVATRQMVLTK